MRNPFGYVKNISDRPIPDPSQYTNDEARDKMNLERREHLEAWDDKYQRHPLDATERARLAEYRRRDMHACIIRVAGTELRFAPGQVYEIPIELVPKVLAQNPERLATVTYDEARAAAATEVYVETPEDARRLNRIVSIDRGPADNLLVDMEWNGEGSLGGSDVM